MYKKQILLSLMAMIWVLLAPIQAYAFIGLCCGKCGGNMPMDIPGGGIPETHEFRFKIQPSVMHMSGLQNASSNIDANSLLGMPVMMGKPTGKYMAIPTSMDMSMLNMAAGYSFTDDFFAGIMTMYVDKQMNMTFNTKMHKTTGKSDFTMTSKGITDTMLMTKYRLFSDDPQIPSSEASLFAGLSIPTGSIDQRNSTHPLTIRKKELLPYGMQLGSGTWDPTLGLLYQSSVSPWWWGVDGRYTQRLGLNKRGYGLGNQTKIDAYVMYQPDVSLTLYGELNGFSEGRMKGEADAARSGASGHATQGNAASPYTTPLWNPAFSGKTQVFTTVGIQWQPVPLQIVDIGVKLPIYQQMKGIQLKDKWAVMLTWYVELPTLESIRSRSYTDRAADAALGF